MAYSLTPLGKSKALRVDRVKEPENAVIAYMYETKEAVELEEVAGELNMDEEATRRVLSRLVSGNYVKEL